MSRVIPRFEFVGFHGRRACCRLELIDRHDGTVEVIATELADNPGVSVTNFAEGLATTVVGRFGLDPDRLVWIEHYPADPCPACAGTGRRGETSTRCTACQGRGCRREAATYDRVTFTATRTTGGVVLTEPHWSPMHSEDWQTLRLPPRT